MTKKLVLLSTQGTEKAFEDLYDKIEMVGPKTTFDFNTTVLFEGGTDVNPAIYGEPRSRFTDPSDRVRDNFEIKIFQQAARSGANCLGICRGSQFLTAMNGGKLIQDVSGHGQNHEVLCNGGLRFWVTSTHHQMNNPAATLKENKDFLLLAWTPHPISGHYWGGNEEKIYPPEKEPEIIFYPKTKSLAIQGHPEYLETQAVFSRYCRHLVKVHLFGLTDSFKL